MRLSDYSTEHQLQAKATLFAKFIQELCLNGGREVAALQTCLAAESESRSPLAPILEKALDGWQTKAATVGSSTNWGTPLSLATELASSFVTLMEAESVLRKIPGLRRVPPTLPIPVSTASGVAGWVGELKPKPFTTLTLGSLTVPTAKAVAQVALSKELLKSGPGAALLVRDTLTATLAAFIDGQFTNPAVAAVTGVNPASITNGTTGLVSTGVPTTDIPVLISAFYAGRPYAARPVLLVSPATASALALGKVDPGMPVVTSPSLGPLSIVLDAAAVATAGTDDIGVMVSEQALIEVSDTPTAPATASTVYFSLYQNNAVGVQAEWFISWARADVSAVKYSAPA
jgi:HK97 family phage major capsid protein